MMNSRGAGGESALFSALESSMADIISKVVEAVKNYLTYMTWSKLLLIVGSGITVVLLTTSWEKRADLYSIMRADKFTASNVVLKSVSPQTKEDIKTYVNSDPNVVAMQVLSTDWSTMVRNTVFFYSKRRELQQDFELFYDNKKAPTAIMPLNDVEQNNRMIRIINQVFVCVPITAEIQRNVPSSAKYAKQICSVTVPPRYGDMVGYITIWLAEPLDENNIDYYHNLARILSNEIYKRDIVRRP